MVFINSSSYYATGQGDRRPSLRKRIFANIKLVNALNLFNQRKNFARKKLQMKWQISLGEATVLGF